MHHENFKLSLLAFSFLMVLLPVTCKKPSEKLVRKSAGCYAKRAHRTTAHDVSKVNLSGLERKYITSVRTLDSQEANPFRLVFIWHALGQSIESIYPWPMESLVDSDTIFIYPQGVDYLGAPGWYADRGSVDFQFFDYLYDEVTNTHCVNLNEVYSVGYSFGAIMANNLACYRGDKFRGVGLLSGLNPADMKQCGDPVNILIAHGEQDDHPIVSFQRGEESRRLWLGHNQCSSSTKADSACLSSIDCKKALIWCPFQGTHRKWAEFDANFLKFTKNLD